MNTSHPQADSNLAMSDFDPSTLSREEACMLTQPRWLFGMQANCHFGLLAFGAVTAPCQDCSLLIS